MKKMKGGEKEMAKNQIGTIILVSLIVALIVSLITTLIVVNTRSSLEGSDVSLGPRPTSTPYSRAEVDSLVSSLKEGINSLDYQTFELGRDDSGELRNSQVVYLRSDKYTFRLLSATDTSALIRVTDRRTGLNEEREIAEGRSKDMFGVTVIVLEADETNLNLRVKLRVVK